VTDDGILDEASLSRYADALVKGCVGLRRGDVLVVQGQPAHRELLVAVAASGYRAGARLVDVVYGDPRVTAARIRYGRPEAMGAVSEWARRRARALVGPDAAVVSSIGEGDPGVFDGLAPERIASDQAAAAKTMKSYVKAMLDGRVRWAGAAWPTDHWAAQVYPELPVADAKRTLARDLLRFCRLTDEDGAGVSGWTKHVRGVAARAGRLTKLRLERVELRGPGTELDVRLPPSALWLGGRERNAYGQMVAPNMPTEECFTSPEPAATEGTFRCSRPLAFQGRLLEGLAGEFRGGRLVRLEAARDQDRDFLAAFLDSDRTARRLGEIALVDRSSLIGQSGRTYFNTLIDENAAAHIAFGAGFANTRARENGKRARAVNNSTIHIDVMIGTDDLEATGIGARGRRVALIRGGEWQV
jgi:aminopeptidase